MPVNPRIEELRRRIERDPASMAFAQLAEEYRRSGSHQDAVETCRAGLAVHPGYLSARVTLGRALLELNDLDAAALELSAVLRSAPDNLAAVRTLASIYRSRGQLREALAFYEAALGLAKNDPDLERSVEEMSRALAAESTRVEVPVPEQRSAGAVPALERFLDAIHSHRRVSAV